MTDETAAAPVPSFAELGLPESLVEVLAARGITTPTPIQAGIIPHALTEGDILAQARTGSGKTLAFLLPLVARIQAGTLKRAWIICPTRELAQQTAREAQSVLGDRAVAVLVGGVPPFGQIKDLRRNPPIVIGTPGRMCDHLSQGNLTPDAGIIVLDEADQMLDMGFAEDLEHLVRDLGDAVARWLFSATFPRQVQDAVGRWLEKPREVRLDTRSGTTHIPQKAVVVRRGEELAALCRLLHINEPPRALVFVRTREDVEGTVRTLNAESIQAAGISGDLTQEARERVLERFRSGKLTVLVGTDVAARGIDVAGVTHVFNLGLPTSGESYTHRIGRTARAGAEGEAWTVLGQSDTSRFQRMMTMAKCRVEVAELPTAAALVSAKRERLAKRIQDSLGEELPLPAEFKAMVEEFTAEAVLSALVHRLIPDAPVERAAAPRGPARRPDGGEPVPLFIAIGAEDDIAPGPLVALLCHQCDIRGVDIGRIRVLARHSLVSVAAAVADQVIGTPLQYRGRAISVRQDREPSGDGAPVRRGPPRAKRY
jgi:ATP-dependent RNA helicase DeaD